MDDKYMLHLRTYENYARYNLCSWYGPDFLFTIKPIITHMHRMLSDMPVKEVNTALRARLDDGYFAVIRDVIANLEHAPHYEQRSPEWFAFRGTLITGSEAGYMLGVCGRSRAISAFKGKVLGGGGFDSSAPALQHGINYECVAKHIYEVRYRVGVLELGCIQSAGANNFIGASPDGIVNQVDDSVLDSWIRYGRMLEIKCPYSRMIDDTIKPEYEIQMLQQQYTCRLPICDFLECGIIDSEHPTGLPGIYAYIDIDDMLADTYDGTSKIQNHRIPRANLSGDGHEKGVMIIAYKVGDNNTQFLYPITGVYTKSAIMAWYYEKQKEIVEAGFSGVSTRSWRVYRFSVKTKIYNQYKYEDIHIPRLRQLWNKITTLRTAPEDQRPTMLDTTISDLFPI